MPIPDQTIETEIVRRISVDIKVENDYLMAWVDGDMQDGCDYSEFVQRLNDGETLESMADEITEMVSGTVGFADGDDDGADADDEDVDEIDQSLNTPEALIQLEIDNVVVYDSKSQSGSLTEATVGTLIRATQEGYLEGLNYALRLLRLKR